MAMSALKCFYPFWQRYREASDVIKKGKMCSLFINDLDAGAGRMGAATQYTVGPSFLFFTSCRQCHCGMTATA